MKYIYFVFLFLFCLSQSKANKQCSSHFDTEKTRSLVEAFSTMTGFELKNRINALLEKGADPNEMDNQGQPVLSLAIHNRNIQLIKKLLEKGADPNKLNKYRETPFIVASFMSHNIKILKLLSEYTIRSKKLTPSRIERLNAIMENSSIEYQNIVINKKDINKENEQGITPLMYATWNGDLSSVKHLLETGADPNKRNRNNNTALFYAIVQIYKSDLTLLNKSHYVDIIRTLYLYGEYPNMIGIKSEYTTPIHSKEDHIEKEILQILSDELSKKNLVM